MTVELAGEVLPRRGWRLSAACRDTLPEAWDRDEGAFGGSPSGVPAWQVEMCLGCPVLADCAADALEHRDKHTVRATVALAGRGGRNDARLEAVLRSAGAQPA